MDKIKIPIEKMQKTINKMLAINTVFFGEIRSPKRMKQETIEVNPIE